MFWIYSIWKSKPQSMHTAPTSTAVSHSTRGRETSHFVFSIPSCPSSSLFLHILPHHWKDLVGWVCVLGEWSTWVLLPWVEVKTVMIALSRSCWLGILALARAVFSLALSPALSMIFPPPLVQLLFPLSLFICLRLFHICFLAHASCTYNSTPVLRSETFSVFLLALHVLGPSRRLT